MIREGRNVVTRLPSSGFTYLLASGHYVPTLVPSAFGSSFFLSLRPPARGNRRVRYGRDRVAWPTDRGPLSLTVHLTSATVSLIPFGFRSVAEVGGRDGPCNVTSGRPSSPSPSGSGTVRSSSLHALPSHLPYPSETGVSVASATRYGPEGTTEGPYRTKWG